MDFDILGEIAHAGTFAIGSSIRELARLRRLFGRGRWRKRKGIARVRLSDGSIRIAEIHWYEAHGVGQNSSLHRLDHHANIRKAICNLY